MGEADLSLTRFFTSAFPTLNMIEIQLRLQKSMTALSEMAPEVYEKVMNTYADRAIRYAESALKLPEEIEQLKAIQCGKC